MLESLKAFIAMGVDRLTEWYYQNYYAPKGYGEKSVAWAERHATLILSGNINDHTASGVGPVRGLLGEVLGTALLDRALTRSGFSTALANKTHESRGIDISGFDDENPEKMLLGVGVKLKHSPHPNFAYGVPVVNFRMVPDIVGIDVLLNEQSAGSLEHPEDFIRDRFKNGGRKEIKSMLANQAGRILTTSDWNHRGHFRARELVEVLKSLK